MFPVSWDEGLVDFVEIRINLNKDRDIVEISSETLDYIFFCKSEKKILEKHSICCSTLKHKDSRGGGGVVVMY